MDAGQGVALDMMTARFVRHRFAPHTHDEYAIGVCFEGVEVIDYRGTRHYSGPGSLVVVEPGEVHTGAAAVPSGFAYRVLYPQWSMMAADSPPHFRDLVIEDPELAERARRTHVALSRWRDPLEAESRLQWLIAEIVHRHAASSDNTAGPRDTVASAGHSVAMAAMDRLAGDMLDPPSLQQIAASLGLSRFQLLRTFRETVGIPPYAWLAQYRVGRARALLADGFRPAQAATMTGFADQAHLTRWFRRVVGVTPGAFRNSIQDSHPPEL